jgi:Predicted ATPase (AAA+ superfamily)
MQFQVGKPVSGDNFTGREKETGELIRLLSNGQSAVLIAPRRYGKTSVMLSVLNQLKAQGIYTTYIDIFSVADIKRLSEQLSKAILANEKLDQLITSIKRNLGDIFKTVEFKTTVEDFEFLLKFAQSETNPWELFDNTLDFAEKFAAKNGKQLVIGFDEFGDIHKLGADDLGKMLRAKIQQQRNVTYIFSGSYESVMSQLFTTVKSPFYRFARILYLGNIEKEAFESFYDDKLREAGLKPNKQLTRRILDFTGGHPYYSALFLQQWLLNPEIAKTNADESFDILTDMVLDIEKPYLEKCWEDVSGQNDQRTMVTALVENKRPYTIVGNKKINISRTLQKLESRSIILRSGRGWKFTDPLFEMWIQKRVLGE